MIETPVPEPENAGPMIHPWDRYNQELVSQVHPLDWTNPAPPGWARRSRWSSGT